MNFFLWTLYKDFSVFGYYITLDMWLLKFIAHGQSFEIISGNRYFLFYTMDF